MANNTKFKQLKQRSWHLKCLSLIMSRHSLAANKIGQGMCCHTVKQRKKRCLTKDWQSAHVEFCVFVSDMGNDKWWEVMEWINPDKYFWQRREHLCFLNNRIHLNFLECSWHGALSVNGCELLHFSVLCHCLFWHMSQETFNDTASKHWLLQRRGNHCGNKLWFFPF